ncbi:MAG: murein transglycosylase A [Hyphomicrobiaceae bacterium]
MKPQWSYQHVAFGDLPGWESDDQSEALAAFADCREALQIDSNHDTAAADYSTVCNKLLAACDEACGLVERRPAPAVARAFFERHFEPHCVINRDVTGLLTGYYEPVLSGSRLPSPTHNVPVYRRPADLVERVADDQRGASGELLTHVRRTSIGFEPYPTRAQIEQGVLDGQGLELFYLMDPVDTFFLHVQGSGLIRLDDGESMRVTFDGKNGHPYTSIGRSLADEGVMERAEITLRSLSAWLKADPCRARDVMWRNKSFIFFKELGPADLARPIGIKNIPLTANRSLAVDGSCHAAGLPIFVSSPKLTHADVHGRPFARLMIAQDAGSAITGPERGDIYFGSGDEAGHLAGLTKHQGSFFVLLPKSTLS